VTPPRWERVLLKLSGEVLAGGGPRPLSSETIEGLVAELKAVRDLGVQLAVLPGGGNIIRGLTAAARGRNRQIADQMGMLGTVINALALKESFLRQGVPAEVLSARPIPGICPAFDREAALAALERGHVLLFGQGTGHPFFSTDTAAALRALQIDAEVLLKGTKVRGVFSRDPRADEQGPPPVFFPEITYDRVIRDQLRVMDLTAVSLCRDNALKVLVFDVTRPDNIRRAVTDPHIGTLISERSAQC